MSPFSVTNIAFLYFIFISNGGVDFSNKKHWTVVAIALVVLVIFLAIGFGVSASHNDELDLFEKSGKGDGMGKRNRRESILGKSSNRL